VGGGLERRGLSRTRLTRTRRAQDLFGGQRGRESPRNCLISKEHSVGCHGARLINNINDARTSGKIAALGLICQGTMLVETDLIIVCIALAGKGASLLKHQLVILGHQVQEMSQVHCLSSVFVMNHAKRERLAFDASCTRALDTLIGGGGEIGRRRCRSANNVVRGLSGGFGWLWPVGLVLPGIQFC
jgi:hypothetical protein